MEYLVFLKVSLGLIGAITASLIIWSRNKSKGLKKPLETEDGYLVENDSDLEGIESDGILVIEQEQPIVEPIEVVEPIIEEPIIEQAIESIVEPIVEPEQNIVESDVVNFDDEILIESTETENNLETEVNNDAEIISDLEQNTDYERLPDPKGTPTVRP